MEIFAERTGIKLLHVPYRGGSALVNGLLTGEIQAGWSGLPNVISHINGRQPCAVCASACSNARCRCRTCRPATRLGIKGFDIADMLGLQAPAGMSLKVGGAIAGCDREGHARTGDGRAHGYPLAWTLQENGTANYVRFMQDDLDRLFQGDRPSWS